MGQKVHPIGLRVGITKKHQSQWFARFSKKKYAQSIREDYHLRQTILKLFPQLLNPVLKKQGNTEPTVTPKITQIKIERSLIPYEIGIQIYAENCEIIKSSIENMQLKPDLLTLLRKTRDSLETWQTKLQYQLSTQNVTKQKTKGNSDYLSDKDQALSTKNNQKNSLDSRINPEIDQFNYFPQKQMSTKKVSELQKTNLHSARLTKQQLRRKRLLAKRLQKRRDVRTRYKKLTREAKLFLTKKGSMVVQKMKRFLSTENTRKKTRNSFTSGQNPLIKSNIMPSTALRQEKGNPKQLFQLRLKKKFVSQYLNKMNKKFFHVLKLTLSNYQQLEKESVSIQNTNNSAELYLNKKWNFQLIRPHLVKKSLSQLVKLIMILEQKSLQKMESLRKEFLTFGTVSSLSYYQMLKFLQELKIHVSEIQANKKFQHLTSPKIVKGSNVNNTFSLSRGKQNHGLPRNSALKIRKSSPLFPLNLEDSGNPDSALIQKITDINTECRKIQLVEYFKQLIKKHRTDNIFIYLSTIGEARRHLRQLRRFTKRNAQFLFGSPVSPPPSELNKQKISDRVKLVIQKSPSLDKQKSLQKILLEQIEKQRTMYIDNIELTPKIAFQFYTVKQQDVKTKASIVADSVIDALEQRKAFRRVIKDAKQNLMRGSVGNSPSNPVKGVKIQVSGRLNGAEIARSEWVRAGRVPLQTLRANLDYSYKTAHTIYGIIGVKVWIFKGYIQ